mmetsp:Transcript_35565/g.101267  ORF Transcript_35565/g.101267 Transcript_35565/m.101267 type:complete len:195 (-) Transcript_35565:168-752(-)
MGRRARPTWGLALAVACCPASLVGGLTVEGAGSTARSGSSGDPRRPVGPLECHLLERSMKVKVIKCKPASFAKKWEGCTCRIPLPSSVHQMPDTFYDPYALEIPISFSMTTFSPLTTQPPASSPAAPYSPPTTPAACPFSRRCAGSTPCVGFDSWGFQEVRMSRYTPASGFFNEITCNYINDGTASFTEPTFAT